MIRAISSFFKKKQSFAQKDNKPLVTLPKLVMMAKASSVIGKSTVAHLRRRVAALERIVDDTGGKEETEQLAKLMAEVTKAQELVLEFKQCFHIDPLTPLVGEAADVAQRVALELGVVLEAEAPKPLSATEFKCASKYVRRVMPYAQRRFSTVQFRLDQLLLRWPTDAVSAAAHVAAHSAIHEGAMEELRLLVHKAVCNAVREAVSAATEAPRVSTAAERTTRAAAEQEFMSQLAYEAYKYAQFRERAWRVARVAEMDTAPDSAPLARLVRESLRESWGSADNVHDFSAFKDAKKLPFVQEQLRKPLKFFNGILVSEETITVKITGQWFAGAMCLAALSTDGTLCWVSREVKQNRVWNADPDTGVRMLLNMHNLLTQRNRVLEVEPDTWMCVCDDELFVGRAWSRTVQFAPLARAFVDLALADFQTFDVPWRFHPTMTDRAHEGWIVCLAERDDMLVRIDLFAKKAYAFECDRRLFTIGPLSSISVPNALCTASELARSDTVVTVFEDGRTEEVARGLGDFPTLLPSAVAPEDLTRAAVIDFCANVWYNGSTNKLTKPVEPASRSLLRLYRDVFLCWAASTSAWAAVRIVVREQPVPIADGARASGVRGGPRGAGPWTRCPT
eukprot:gnl/Chilomastix_cuspidata/2361.p1 GENE.gnl/Chilomastix_cuspidata/2361~~gnl/Chilomastix_cuspidata/2361.p1  ORF type:complete len:622 (-),score=167.60 gnl/Chilomastix_cuspidata/2361:116-1981(-)